MKRNRIRLGFVSACSTSVGTSQSLSFIALHSPYCLYTFAFTPPFGISCPAPAADSYLVAACNFSANAADACTA